MPPPASARLKPLGQWSRPPVRLILGVRPNSPQQSTTVRSSAFLRFRSRSSAANAGSRILTLRAMNRVVVDVGVPAIERHLDAAHADLDQPAGGQAAAAERSVAVLGADARGFLRHVERLELLGGHHHAGAGERLAVQRGLDAAAPAAGEGPLEDLQVADARQVARAGHSGGHVGQGPLRIADLEGVELAPQEAAAAGPLAGQDRDVPRDVGPAHRQLVAADRADRGVLDRRVGPIAGLHQVRAALVVPLLAHHRPDQGDRAHLVGQLLEALGELNARYGGRDRLGPAGDPRVGVRVERLELAGPAAQPQEDDRLRRLPRPLGLVGQQLPDRRQPGEPGQLEEAAAVEYSVRSERLMRGLNGSMRIPSC